MSQEAPDSDVDEPVENHVEELLYRLFIVSSVGISVSLIILPISDLVIKFLWNSHIPSPDMNQPRLYSPLSLILTRIRIVVLAGLAVSFPLIVHQAYKFMKPGLYELEQYYFKVSILTSFLLSNLGILVSHFVVIPLLFSYFTAYNKGAAELAYGLQQTVGIMITIMIYMTIIFQIPILVILAVKTGVVDVYWIARRRLLFWGTLGGLSFIASPDPTGTAPLITGVITIILFEISLFIARKLPETGNEQ